ncbi:hypothetical protein LZ31DRAFT_275429 [Colletotrichum somersetense]|nr:hypothetical protein LZ31DRAFT_275429 [Colletotrichum somersetense]
MGGMFFILPSPHHRVRSLPSQLGDPSSIIRHSSLITFFSRRGGGEGQVTLAAWTPWVSSSHASERGEISTDLFMSNNCRCAGSSRRRRGGVGRACVGSRTGAGCCEASPAPRSLPPFPLCRRTLPIDAYLHHHYHYTKKIKRNQFGGGVGGREKGPRLLSAGQKNGGHAGDEHPCPSPPTGGGGRGSSAGGGAVGGRDHEGPVPAAVDRGLPRHAGVVGRLVVPHLGEVRLRARGDAGGGREEVGVVSGAAGVGGGRLDRCDCCCCRRYDGDGGGGEGR